MAINNPVSPQDRLDHAERLERLEIDLIKRVENTTAIGNSNAAAVYAKMYRDIRTGRKA